MMAALLSYSTVGFYKTPVTKGILGTMLLTSCALHVPLLHHLHHSFVYNLNEILIKFNVTRIMAAKLAFLDMKDLVCGCLLLYYFRIFERRYGSHKFASYLLSSSVIATCLELLISALLRKTNLVHIDILPSGPFSLIFPLFVNYLFDIPRLTRIHLLGVPVTGKSLTYLLGLQVMSSSQGSLICSISGILAGIICRFNLFYICDLIKIPHSVAKLTEKLFGWLMESSPPPEASLPMGATLEIQRQQQMEVLEQQMLLARARDFRERTTVDSNNITPNNLYDNRHQNHQIPGPSSREMNFIDHPDAMIDGLNEPIEEQIETLVEMGFERSKVIDALFRSNNDLNSATTILLSEG